MASADLRHELLCSIYMNIYTDPVTLRCGHSFCRVCIDGVLDTEGGYGVYTCPECRATFQKWSPLQKNITLCNVVELISHLSHTLSAMIRNINVIFHVQDPADILLDVNTAANNLLISDDLKTATWTEITQNRPETAERFQDYPQVMSGRRFTSGRHYWDVEISRSGIWIVGMCYHSIDRRGRQSYIGNNNKSWGFYKRPGNNNQYSVIHENEITPLPHQISSDRFRICLDYEAGQLSFYELCDPIRHLHTFTATFTEPLHAVLCVFYGSIKISGSSCEEPSS